MSMPNTKWKVEVRPRLVSVLANVPPRGLSWKNFHFFCGHLRSMPDTLTGHLLPYVMISH
jgi:hypothetical protein